ncbi:Glucokinase regulator family [Mycena venus]|uniref:Glucokinase regulator family n=1 Tax=Mycena venus TaxID=2733690 RepID=A0A8H6YKM3_9AGAR|nr:Glucokinase regulator family [Mycena venus]
MCRLINAEDALVASAVAEITPAISAVIDCIVERMQEGGRLLYMGAGTSGRLGVLDLSDIPQSYNGDPMRYIALAAGGDVTLRTARPPVEDSRAAGSADLGSLLPVAQDTLIGISASGRTPYVLGALHSARAHGLLTVGLVHTRSSAVLHEGQCDYVPRVRRWTRSHLRQYASKSGHGNENDTEHDLNRRSNQARQHIRKLRAHVVYSHQTRTLTHLLVMVVQMVDVHPSNVKFASRARSIIRDLAGSVAGSRAEAYSDEELDGVIARCGGSVKLAVVVVASGWGVALCVDALERRGGSLREVLEDVRYETIVRVFV